MQLASTRLATSRSSFEIRALLSLGFPRRARTEVAAYLIARIGLNRGVLLEAAASAAGCVKSGSGGAIRHI
jgi:hypothetical protein